MVPAWLIALFTSLVSLVFGYDEADLVFAGDAMQHQDQLDAARRSGGYDYSGCFADLDPLVSTADYAVVNLETPVGNGRHSGYPCFFAPPEYVDALAGAGFDMFLTANNHTLDRGAAGLRSTIAELESRGLDHLGTYSDAEERAQALPLVRRVGKFDIGFLNYTYGTNGITPRDGVVVDYIDRARIKADVEATRAAGVDLICVCIHWGDEYRLLPNAGQRRLADYLEALGVDMIIGSHPHVIQPMEFRPNKYVPDKSVLLVYSLGNFISNMKTPDTRGGAMVHVHLFRGEDRRPVIQSADYRLVFTIPGAPGGENYRLQHPDSVTVEPWRSRAAEFSTRARRIFGTHNIGVPER